MLNYQRVDVLGSRNLGFQTFEHIFWGNKLVILYLAVFTSHFTLVTAVLGATLFMEIEGAGNTWPRALRLTYSSDWLLIWHFLASKNWVDPMFLRNFRWIHSIQSVPMAGFHWFPIQIVSGPRWSSCGAWRTAHHPVGHLRPLLPPGRNPERSGPGIDGFFQGIQMIQGPKKDFKSPEFNLSWTFPSFPSFPSIFHLFHLFHSSSV